MSSINIQNKTDYRFKLLYAIGIVLVTCGHCNDGTGINILYDWFIPYSYHLAIFVFSSGYFYKSQNEKHPLKYCIKKVKNLLVPLYLWNFFYALVVTLSRFQGFEIGDDVTLRSLFIEPILHGHQFMYNLGGWFIIPLFMIEIFNVLIRKLLFFINEKIKDFVIFVIFLLLGMIGINLSIKGFNTGLYLPLMRFLHLLPFYALGTLYKTKLEKYDNLSNLAYFGIIIAIQLLVICVCRKVPFYISCWCSFPDNAIIPYIEGSLGIFFWFRICRILEPVLGRSKTINAIADNTFSIMINHLMGFMIIKTVFALCYKYLGLFSLFNYEAYKTDIYYIYEFGNLRQMQIVYIIFAIWFSVMLQKGINLIKHKITSTFSRGKD